MDNTDNNYQKPQTLFSSGESNDSLNLTNYIDQAFNVKPVSVETVPLVTKTEDDVKFDNKLNINFDNLSSIGSDNVRAMISPSNLPQVLDIQEIIDNQGVYMSEQAGYVSVFIENPVQGDYVSVRCSETNLINSNSYIDVDIPIGATIAVSKYQTVVFKWNTSTASIKSIVLVPFGIDTNVGESLIDTRDYQAIMADIGFPSIPNSQTLSLPPNEDEQIVEIDGYYSLSATLSEGDYFTITTESYGSTISYNGTNQPQYIFIPAPSQSLVKFEYSLSGTLNYLKFIPTKGGAHSNDNY